jgi:hypothetical protein
MPHLPLATFRNLDPSHAAHILAFDRRYRVGQFLDHLMLLLGIEHVLDEMNFYQWHCRPPKWQPRIDDMSAACLLRLAKALREL